MKKKSNNQEYLELLIKIDQKENITQREIAKDIGISLGKINFLILELKKKGLIKIKNFRESENKIRYAYIITPQGISEKIKLTLSFMKRKMQEYDYLKSELKKSQRERRK